MELSSTKLNDAARLPTRAHEGDAGLDLYACEPAHVGPGERWSIGTGVAVEIPAGHAGLVLPRSGLAREHGISLVNSPGLIDSGYRGEVRVLLLNTDPAEIFRVEAGRPDRPAAGGRRRARRAGRGGRALATPPAARAASAPPAAEGRLAASSVACVRHTALPASLPATPQRPESARWRRRTIARPTVSWSSGG